MNSRRASTPRSPSSIAERSIAVTPYSHHSEWEYRPVRFGLRGKDVMELDRDFHICKRIPDEFRKPDYANPVRYFAS